MSNENISQTDSIFKVKRTITADADVTCNYSQDSIDIENTTNEFFISDTQVKNFTELNDDKVEELSQNLMHECNNDVYVSDVTVDAENIIFVKNQVKIDDLQDWEIDQILRDYPEYELAEIQVTKKVLQLKSDESK